MWNERYADTFAAYGTEPNDFLAEVADRIPDGRVLCLAAGEGRNAVFLAGRGFDVTAMDQSEVGLSNAARLADTTGVPLRTAVADLATFDFGEAQWVGITAIWAHVPPDLRKAVHAACVRALKPGGALVLEAYSPAQLDAPGVGGPPVASLLMSAAGLREELHGLEFEICREVEREVAEGKHHQGLSATTQVLAFRPHG
ncbi:MAG: SAM-dependent methyltransferase [Bradymonadia bacterium]|jgi:SAM-dependent methyltransferase